MIVEFDDKYKAMIVVRITLTFLLLTPSLAHSKCIEAPDSIPRQFLMLHGLDTLFIGNQPEEISEWSKNHLRPYWKQGYALARWELQPASKEDHRIIYRFIQDHRITKGKITGWNAAIMDESLAPLVLNWKKGKLFNHVQPKQLTNVYGIQITRTELFFEDSIAQLKVSIGPSNNQYFDGLLGLQQVENKSVMVGDFKMNWVNAWKKGESFFFRWQRQDISTQRLELNAQIPFMFHRAFGLTNYFDFYRKKDQVFQTQLKTQLLFHLQNQQTWSTGIELKNNQSLRLGDQLYSQHQLWVNTWKDRDLMLEFAAGRRKATQNIADSLVKKIQKLYRWEGHWTHGWRQKSWVLNTQLHSMGYYAPQLELAEMLRIGGPRNIRGFNVESIFVKQWHGFQSEWGYQITDVLAYIFIDGGISQNITIQNYHQSYGLGAKINRNDILLSLEYGWGIFPQQSIDLRQGVLHIGFNQRF